jgi:hypothetical protein
MVGAKDPIETIETTSKVIRSISAIILRIKATLTANPTTPTAANPTEIMVVKMKFRLLNRNLLRIIPLTT